MARRLGWVRRLHAPNSWAFGSVVLFTGTAASRVLGFFRELAMAALFGTSAATDAWLMASILPNLLFSAVNAALSNVVVPVMAGHSQHTDDEVLYVREMIALVGGVALVLTVVAEGVAPVLVRMLAPGFDAPQWAQTVLLTRIMLPTIVFWAGTGLATGVLQAKAIYAPTSAAPVLVNVVRITTILLFGTLWGISGVAIGFVIAVASQWIYLLPALKAQGFSLRPRWRIRHPWTFQTLRLTGPFLLTSGAGALGVLVDRILASTLPTGNIAALNYAFLLTQLPLGLLVNAVALPGFTRLAAEWNGEQARSFVRVLQYTLELALLVAIPCAVFLLMAADPVVHLLYQRGAFTTLSTGLTAHVLGYWAVGLPGFAGSLVLSRALFALRATKPMIFVSIATVAFNVAGDLILIHPLGAAGLALATAGASWISGMLTLTYLAWRQLAPPGFLSARVLLKYVGASALLLEAAKITMTYLRPTFASDLASQILGLLELLVVFGLVWFGALRSAHWLLFRG